MADKQIYPMISEKSWWQLRNQFKKTIPSVVNVSYLKSLLSLNSDQSARNILAPLRQMGIIDADGKPQLTGEVMLNTQTYVPLLLLKSILKSCSIFFLIRKLTMQLRNLGLWTPALWETTPLARLPRPFLC